MENFWVIVKNFNDHYAQAASFLVALIATIVAGYFYGVYKESKLKEGDSASIVNNIF